MLDAHRTAMWIPISEPGGIPKYYRQHAGAYSIRRVLEPVAAGRRLERHWALYWKNRRMWELQAMPDLSAAMEQAECWLLEQGIVK